MINVGDEVNKVVERDDIAGVACDEEMVAAVIAAVVVADGRLYFRFAARLWPLSPDSA